MFPPTSVISKLLYLGFPVWGSVLVVGLSSLLPKGASGLDGNFLVFLAFISPLVGAVPIYQSPNESALYKVFVFIVYYGASLLALFVAGWAAIGFFFPHSN
jgi:hypothetical protein